MSHDLYNESHAYTQVNSTQSAMPTQSAIPTQSAMPTQKLPLYLFFHHDYPSSTTAGLCIKFESQESKQRTLEVENHGTCVEACVASLEWLAIICFTPVSVYFELNLKT